MKDDYEKYKEYVDGNKILYKEIIDFKCREMSKEDKIMEYIKEGNTDLIINKCNLDISRYNKEIEAIEKNIKELNKLEFNKEKIKKLKAEIKLLNDNIGEMELVLKNKNDDSDEEECEKNNIPKLNAEIEKLETKIEESKNKLNKIKIKFAIIEGKLKQMESNKSKINKLKEELLEYKFYVEAVSKEGVPNMLLKKFIPNIQNQVNEILAIVCDFLIEIECKNKDIKLFIVKQNKNNDNKSNDDSDDSDDPDDSDDSDGSNNSESNTEFKYSAQTASGFEKAIVNIAVRVVFSKMTCLSKPNIFIVDEMMACMDNENKNNISSLFEYLKTQFDIIIIISHLEEFKSAVDKIIHLEKKNNCSRINNTQHENLKNIFKLQFKSKTKIIANKSA
jgi:exonuclease SbcC